MTGTIKSYRVTWEIDIEAESPELAARQALAIQRKAGSWATVFMVYEHGHDVIGATLVDLGVVP